jgi:hypothetical protein
MITAFRLPEMRHMTRRRSSASVTLVLIGASTLTGCGQQAPDTLRRDMYASQADCAQDWGADPAKCEPVKTGSSSSSGGRGGGGGGSSYTHYYGPAYSHGSYGSTNTTHEAGTTSQARPGSRAIGTAHVSRGGFGASASAHGSGSRGSSAS